ncbi:1-acyl-sn-glycerol-3-phosphate acyltransferase [Massilia sp. CF038]|uniref:lysophospholipid acyltransferase family protein n=1 Tax=Massilia sp. CF038 TaxID=1881045 RepID=UPI000917FC0B|nr:lysophospholipid acyltransferase family protein [Massilia sp. CF038]SHG36871.1 1-acyl-sn-glycerol-3-phosphate acyltransferase [Massilia sp. CF038]
MKPRLAYRVSRVILHLIGGLAVCALIFPWAGAGLRARVTARWSRDLLGICGVQLDQAEGSAALAHAMIVSNHVSWLDIFVINALYPCRFVAKSEIRAWPVLGWLVDKAGTVFIARGNRRELRNIFKGMVQALQAGERVAFFPEGTTALQGQVLPFHANLFEAAVDAGVAVQPYALRYVDGAGAFHPNVEYVGERTFVQSMMTVLGGGPIKARLTCLAPIAAANAHRRDVAKAAHDAIAAALT